MKVRHMIRALALGLTFTLLWANFACEEKKDEPLEMGYEYWPQEIGQYWIYSVDSIVWDDFYNPTKIDTFNYKVKEKIAGEFTDEEGRTVKRVERFIKPDDTTAWKLDKVFTMLRRESIAMKTLDNESFVKLVFPFDLGKTWDGNSYNPMDENQYEYISIGEQQIIEGKTYDDCIIVEQENFVTLISNDIAREVYAPGAGMISRYYVNQTLLSSGEIESGVEYSYKLTEHGKD